MKVLFVCSGNICRSPMAAGYLRHRAARDGLPHVVVESAGTLDIEGAPASNEAIAVAAAYGVDLRDHRSRGLGRADVLAADLIVVAALEHLDAIDRRFPEAAARPLLIRAFEEGPNPAAGAPDLEDPIGCDRRTYERCFATIRRCVDQLVLHLRHRR